MDVWTIGPSAIAGNGVIARRPLPPNFEVFRERALVLGPRADPRCLIVCVGCHQTGELRMCSKECGLPVCKTCNDHPECDIFSRLSNLRVREKLALVAPIRAVFLNQEERIRLRQLERHERQGHEKLLTQIEKIFSEEDREIIQICCQVLDATAFETPTKGSASVRGIYPTAGMMNHSCCPNTRHCFDEAGQMVITTTRNIKENEELTTHYCNLTWGTQARQKHLQATKCFTCRCCRCLDPSEFGSQLMGLYCMKKNCGGVLLPTSDTAGSWSCGRCNIKVPALRVSVIQKMIAGAISNLEPGNLAVASRMLCRNAAVPACSYLAVGLKINLVFVYGNCDGFALSELRNIDLAMKKLFSVQLLFLFSLLRLGLSRQRGLILRELATTMRELDKREKSEQDEIFLQKIPNYGSINEIQAEADSILKNDAGFSNFAS